MKYALPIPQGLNYGFDALKAAYLGNFAKGLLLGLAFHSTIVLGFGIAKLARPLDEVKDIFRGSNILITLPEPPPFRTNLPIPRIDNPVTAPVAGTPVIVDDDPVSINTTIPTKDEAIIQVPNIGATNPDGPIEVIIGQELRSLEEASEAETLVSDPPYPISSVKPDYPTMAKLVGIEGRVFVRGLIDENGTVIKTKFVSGSEVFYEASAEAMRATKFKPGVNNGHVVKVWVTMPFTFRLR